ncbi:MAG TPA: HD domain-containing protein, partial [Anaerolineales bacterium]|nr:HD domain-containing protein [Anaerolineales bacterium]
MPPKAPIPAGDLSLYAGRWIARLGGRIVGQGGTPDQALWAARSARFKENAEVEYVPTVQPLNFSERLELVRRVIPADIPVYLVGGAVRDALLNRTTHDLDFAVPADALAIGKSVADTLKAAYYPLDEARQTARVVIIAEDGTRDVLDFAVLRAPDLEGDLRLRDFTINAIAIDLQQPQALLDPLGGAADLYARRLRACSPTALTDDPVRILRGVRLAAELELHIQPPTRKEMRQAVSELDRVSPERKRDELFHILEGPKPAPAIQALDIIGALDMILPEMRQLKGLRQPPPHVSDVWTHTLDVVRFLGAILKVFSRTYDPETSASLWKGVLSLRLGRYREQLDDHLKASSSPVRSLRGLLMMAALYHDVAKPQTQQVDEQGHLRFFKHDVSGANIVEARASALHLSNAEIARLKDIVRHHMRPILLGNARETPSPRAIYRFFQDTG